MAADGADAIRSAGILLGPYRNLSTLTAASLALHPNVQVLNHAAERLWRTAAIDFIGNPEPAVYRQFLGTALLKSAGGRRGNYGGSILHSHAFDDPKAKARYRERFGDAAAKAAPFCLVWKDSMVIQRRLMSDESLLPVIVANLPDLRFILPIRQPIDCALSNLRTGHAKYLTDKPAPTIADVLDAVLQAIAWVLVRRDRWPDRFFVFTEHTNNDDLAGGLAGCLGLPADDRWMADFRAVFRPRAKDRPPADMLNLEQAAITRLLSPWPDLRDAFGR